MYYPLLIPEKTACCHLQGWLKAPPPLTLRRMAQKKINNIATNLYFYMCIMYYPHSSQEKSNSLPSLGAALEGGSPPENKFMKTTIFQIYKCFA